MGDILYGVKLVILDELDPATQAVKVDGVSCRIDTAEEVGLDAVVSEGTEEHKRTDDRILAIVRTPNLLYGYDMTLKDNTFDTSVAALIEGGVIETDVSGNITGYRSPFISEGATNMKPFRAKFYVANYEGDSIKNYAVVTMNNCSGVAPSFKAAKEFYAPEFKIKAREATKAGLPIKGITYVDTLPAQTAPTITASTVGTLGTDAITAIPANTTVADLLAGLTYTAGASAKIIDQNGYDVTTGTVTNNHKARVYYATNVGCKTDYTLTLAVG